MVSEIGVNGTVGRCYPFYADLRKCISKKHEESPQTMCISQQQDYFECLHGHKEKRRIKAVREERLRREKLGESFN